MDNTLLNYLTLCKSQGQKQKKYQKTLLSLQTVPRRGPHRSLAAEVDAKRRCGDQILFARLLSDRLLC